MLVRCPNVFGGFQLERDLPELLTRTNLMVRNHALYDRNRVLVTPSALLREYGPLGFPASPLTSMHNPQRPKRIITEEIYWIGQFHSHFGHYLISTLSRLWAKGGARARIGFTGDLSVQQIFDMPFASQTLGLLGLRPDDFVRLHDLDLLRNVIVPGATLNENSIVYDQFRLFNRSIANRVAQPSFEQKTRKRAVYFSKAKVSAGVSRIRNESVVTDILEKHDIEIVYPEQLSIAAQIGVWNRNDLFVGYAGSALHLAAFAENKKILSLNHSRNAESNQVLIDMVCGHQGAYLQPIGGMEFFPAGNGFHREVGIRDPEDVAASLLRAIERMERDPASLAMRPRPDGDTTSRMLFVDEPFGHNVARNKPARTSSSDPAWQKRTAEGDAEAAVSGALAETFQFHTLNEPSPWWSVDLEARHLVNEIRVFNRHDSCHSRAARLEILVSDDNENWTLVNRREAPGDFDGYDNEPYRWQPADPLLARHVRVRLPDHDMLHLNQVEIFGYRADSAAI